MECHVITVKIDINVSAVLGEHKSCSVFNIGIELNLGVFLDSRGGISPSLENNAINCRNNLVYTIRAVFVLYGSEAIITTVFGFLVGASIVDKLNLGGIEVNKCTAGYVKLSLGVVTEVVLCTFLS